MALQQVIVISNSRLPVWKPCLPSPPCCFLSRCSSNPSWNIQGSRDFVVTRHGPLNRMTTPWLPQQQVTQPPASPIDTVASSLHAKNNPGSTMNSPPAGISWCSKQPYLPAKNIEGLESLLRTRVSHAPSPAKQQKQQPINRAFTLTLFVPHTKPPGLNNHPLPGAHTNGNISPGSLKPNEAIPRPWAGPVKVFWQQPSRARSPAGRANAAARCHNVNITIHPKHGPIISYNFLSRFEIHVDKGKSRPAFDFVFDFIITGQCHRTNID